ncbi:hypothetical protein [Cellulomonas sp. Leaf334]|uniref:hypothetical protein n=1 Tax=Cellulomonas sp. Leaf334 TaxID=1736339 RepID=UPI0007005E11|nr:hypothetical protein [Cellulomonas sp. Leaf334]KQR17317.1 hypothetical protein ASF78_08505 [Cellulomonas sp. Leaf334]
MLTRVAAALLTAVVLLLGALPAAADPECEVTDLNGRCDVSAEAPGAPPSELPPPPPGGGSGSTAPRVCRDLSDDVIDCVSSLGTWSDSRSCYLQLAEPQPPADDPAWEGRTDGVIYRCMIPQPYSSAMWTTYVWFATAQPGPAPRELAQMAIAQMEFRAGQLGMSPAQDALSVVGLQTWLWIADPDEHTVGPMTRSASAGAVTVTATATLESVVWDMGDGGSPVVCDGPGTPYDATLGDESPTCGYTYGRSSAREPDLAYTVTATSRWVVHWTGGGQSGDIPLEFTRSAPVRVGEVQAIVTRAGA